jgi:hypothetical protein
MYMRVPPLEGYYLVNNPKVIELKYTKDENLAALPAGPRPATGHGPRRERHRRYLRRRL